MREPTPILLMEAVPIALVLIDPDERVSAANAPAQALFGAAILGRHYGLAIREPGILEGIEAAFEQGKATKLVYTSLSSLGESRYRVSIRPLEAAPLQSAVLCSFEDITDLEQAEQIRREFVANVSHELRTPLTALLGFIETLRGTARDDSVARERFLSIMAKEAERMNRLVSDLLSLSRVEAQERSRPTEKLDLRAVLGAAITALRPMAEAAQVTIEMIAPEAPMLVLADPDQMTQVFHNLIENAVKYGLPQTAVTLRLSHEPFASELRGPAVRAEVIDRGPGISKLHLPRLTERFYRVDSHRSREKGGTGLGLAIVKHIISRHRGRLLIESTLGQGSRFSVLLPAA